MKKRINSQLLVLSLMLVSIFSSVAFSGDITNKYESNWNTDFNLKISQALAANKIHGCGEFKYKESKKHRGEYIVYCTRDGSNWSAYLVWVPIKKVMGPYNPDPSLK